MEDMKKIVDSNYKLYSLEIYPSSFYDPATILKSPASSLGQEINDLITFSKEDKNDAIDEPEDREEEEETNDIRTKKQIERYIKKAWLPETQEFPFCNKPVCWTSHHIDMTKLSTKYDNFIFILYQKNEIFIDNVLIKIYKDGCLEHSSNKVQITASVCLPGGQSRKINKNGFIETDPTYGFDDSENTRGLSTLAHVATDMTVLIGGVAVDLGQFAAEGAAVAKVAGIGLQLINEMHQNLIRYGDNSGKCKFLFDRCNNIRLSLEKMQRKELDIDLPLVMTLIGKLEEARNLINKYKKQWRITRFLASGSNERKFDSIHGDLNSCMNDMDINISLSV